MIDRVDDPDHSHKLKSAELKIQRVKLLAGVTAAVGTLATTGALVVPILMTSQEDPGENSPQEAPDTYSSSAKENSLDESPDKACGHFARTVEALVTEVTDTSRDTSRDEADSHGEQAYALCLREAPSPTERACILRQRTLPGMVACLTTLPDDVVAKYSCLHTAKSGPEIDDCFGVKASKEDCEKLGDKFVELFMKDQPEDNALSKEILQSAAEAGKEEVVKQCRAELPLKSSIDCALKAATMDELEGC